MGFVYSRSFSGGEVTPQLYGRIDDVRYQTGLAKAQNFIALPHGPARKRPGTDYVCAAKLGSTGKVRLLRYVFSASQAFIIEVGATSTASQGYMRFIRNGAQVLVTDGPAVPSYVVPVTFATAAVNTGTGVITTASAHNLTTGDRIRITNAVSVNGGTLAGQFPSGKYFEAVTPLGFANSCELAATAVYAIVTGATTLKFAETNAAALAGSAAGITSVAAATTMRVSRDYQNGEIVEGTPAGQPGYWLCYAPPVVDGPTTNPPPGASFWWSQPNGIIEVPFFILDSELADLHYWSSNDVVTLVHSNYQVRELQRFTTNRWRVVSTSFTPSLTAPVASVAATQGGVLLNITSILGANPLAVRTATANALVNGDSIYGSVVCALSTPAPLGFYKATNVNGGDFTLTDANSNTINATGAGALVSGSFRAVPWYSDLGNSYVVTAVDQNENESASSNVATVANNLNAEGAYNTVSWGAVTGAVSYRIYRLSNGLYGLIGAVTAPTVTFKDDNLDVALDKAPPIFDSSFGSSVLPSAGCYHEQRRAFASGQTIWMTRTGTESDMSYSLPARDDDRMVIPISALEANSIQHLVSLGNAMLALTNSSEYAVFSPDGTVITPSSVIARPQSFIGASSVRPVLVTNEVVFVSGGNQLMRMVFEAASQGFTPANLSLRARHLTDGNPIVGIAYCQSPYAVIWSAVTDGRLLGTTYLPEQEVVGWHQHTFAGGTVQDVAAIPESYEDRAYVLVSRTINGSTVRYIERMASMFATDRFLDCAKAFTNAPAGALAGLTHLAGQSVSILADGIMLPAQTVTVGGQITLPSVQSTYASVLVGKEIDAQLQFLPLTIPVEGYGESQRKNIANVTVRTVSSGPCKVGPSLSALAPSDSTAPSIRGQLARETITRTENIPVRVPGTWAADSTCYLTSQSPFPCVVAAISFEVAVG